MSSLVSELTFMMSPQTECLIPRHGSRMDMKVSLAVDFTRSNGPPQSPDSLHHHTATRPSSYARAMQSVVAVVQDYNK